MFVTIIVNFDLLLFEQFSSASELLNMMALLFFNLFLVAFVHYLHFNIITLLQLLT